jgi:hypothetical protein
VPRKPGVRIGVGSINRFDAPSSEPDLRICRHPALQSVVLPARGLTCCDLGTLQVEKPKRVKVGNWPAFLVGTLCSGAPSPMGLPAQEASQPAAYKSVFHTECRAAAMSITFQRDISLFCNSLLPGMP